MKLIISSSELLKGVMSVAKAIPAKSPLPILENFLFDLKGNLLEITASDSELTLKTKIEVESTEEEGRIARFRVNILIRKKLHFIRIEGRNEVGISFIKA